MKKYIIIGLPMLTIMLLVNGCGYKGSLLIKENEIIAQSNKPMAITKVIDEKGNVSVTYSSKKNAGWFGNLMTIIGLRAANK